MIGGVAGDLFTEILVYKMYIPGVDQEKADGLMTRVLDMQDNFIARISHTDGKDNKALVKAYYRKLREDFEREVDEISAEISALNKQKEA